MRHPPPRRADGRTDARRREGKADVPRRARGRREVPRQGRPRPARQGGPAPDAQYEKGSVTCEVSDRDLKVGDESIKLGQLRRYESGPPPKAVLDGRVLNGPLSGLESVRAELGGTTVTLDLGKAERFSVEPIDRSAGSVDYRVVAKVGDAVVGELAGTLPITRAATVADGAAGSADARPAVVAPELGDKPVTVPLPAPADLVLAGGGGRFLVVQMKKLQQLAVFNVGRAKVVKLIPLPPGEVTIAAGSSKLLVGAIEPNVIERWDLNTLEKELTAPGPPGGLRQLALGADSAGPAVALGKARATAFLLERRHAQDRAAEVGKDRRGGGAGVVRRDGRRRQGRRVGRDRGRHPGRRPARRRQDRGVLPLVPAPRQRRREPGLSRPQDFPRRPVRRDPARAARDDRPGRGRRRRAGRRPRLLRHTPRRKRQAGPAQFTPTPTRNTPWPRSRTRTSRPPRACRPSPGFSSSLGRTCW